MNPCDIGTLTQKCLLAQKSVESFGVKTLKRIIAPLCARTSKKQESVPGVWAKKR